MSERYEPTSLVLRPGEAHVLRLRARGTAGYSWVAELEGDEGVLTAGVTGAPRGESEGAPAGASADELVTLRALRPGRVTVHLVQQRSWDPTRALDRLTVQVEVVPGG